MDRYWQLRTKRVALVFLLMIGVGGHASAPRGSAAYDSQPSPTADDGDWPAYARLHGLTIEEARDDAALVDQAALLQEELERDFASDFAGMWVERKPTFKLVVAFTSDRSVEVRGRASAALLPYLETRVYERSLRELRDAVAALPMADIAHSLSIDVKTNQIEVQVLPGEKQSVTLELLERIPTDLARVVETTTLPTPVEIYGGLSHTSTCGGLQGTVGFSVKKGTTTGIVTAGHLANCGDVNGYPLTFRDEHNGGISDSQWFTSNTAETPKFRYNQSGATRLVYARRSYSSVVVGSTICKYGRTTYYDCGEVSRKDVDVDGVFGPYSAVWIEIENCGGEDLAEPGDSGGPAFYGTTAIGILTHQGGDIFCGGKGYVNSLSHFEFALSVAVIVSP